jgi:TRAP-type mannitol/chloroaromatic compound transport system permease small subunit
LNQPSSTYLRIIRGIDALIRWAGGIAALLLIPLVLANSIEVFMRYVLDRPTDWAMDTTIMSYGALFMLGAAYALQKGAHVRTDMLWEKFSTRKKGVIDAIAYIVFFLPAMAVLLYVSFGEFTDAYAIGERSSLTLWRPLIWPLRAVVPLATLLLLVQGVSEFLKSLWAARTGEELVHHEKVDI